MSPADGPQVAALIPGSSWRGSQFFQSPPAPPTGQPLEQEVTA